jgi:topoisomerase-4 subunit A
VAYPDATTADLLAHMPGPDFPTGGTMIEEKASLLQAYETGRGGFRVRAKWEVERGRMGVWSIVITEIPYQVQKARLIEQIAQLLEDKKLPLLGDIRDESTETVRLVLEPKTRGVEPEVLMETMFRATALESRFPLNMNVLTADRTPRVLGLKEVLRQWLDHRFEVLGRRSRFRLAAIERRLEILEGFIKVYLNLDEVIRIIRYEDEPKPTLMKTFELNDIQAEAILNMRLRSLRKLEEMEIREEHAKLSAERAGLQKLLGSDVLKWSKITSELKETKAKFGSGPLGDRRTLLGDVPAAIDVSMEAFVEREAITVILSEKGWIRAVKGVVSDASELKFKESDRLRLLIPCDTTARLCLFATNGRAYTLKAGDIPRGRGDGQPVRLLADLSDGDEVVRLFVHRDGVKMLVANAAGRGFLVQSDELAAEKRTGRQILNVKPGEEAAFCIEAAGDHVAVVGENRKLLVFPLHQIPEMQRGQGVILQRYKDGGMRDVKVFAGDDGLTWRLGDKTRTEPKLTEWLGERGQAGKMVPNGFPKSGRFS